MPAGAAIYIWHCTREGAYSLYSTGITNENYLRGLQVTDCNGQVIFTTIIPGGYSGCWPHIHLQAYRTIAEAIMAPWRTDAVLTSQLAIHCFDLPALVPDLGRDLCRWPVRPAAFPQEPVSRVCGGSETGERLLLQIRATFGIGVVAGRHRRRHGDGRRRSRAARSSARRLLKAVAHPVRRLSLR
ncbi:MAG: hypothetical protein AB7S98_00425 [Burkholderiaceae bacterium]